MLIFREFLLELFTFVNIVINFTRILSLPHETLNLELLLFCRCPLIKNSDYRIQRNAGFPNENDTIIIGY